MSRDVVAAIRAFGLAACALASLGVTAPARAQNVDLELLLAVDGSSSVDFNEFELQMKGIAKAFRDPSVVGAIEAHAPNGIAVGLVLWSGEGQQATAVDWSEVRDTASAAVFADLVDATPRGVRGATAIGEMIDYARELLVKNRFRGSRQVIDVSGDGASNQGGPPAFARKRAVEAGITINGLAIMNDEPKLDLYYELGVIGGPDAFLLTVDDFEDFADAMRRKLLREIGGAPLASLDRDRQRLALVEESRADPRDAILHPALR
jgi:hypothetical protein